MNSVLFIALAVPRKPIPSFLSLEKLGTGLRVWLFFTTSYIFSNTSRIILKATMYNEILVTMKQHDITYMYS